MPGIDNRIERPTADWKAVTTLAAFGGATAATAALSTLGMGRGPRSAWYRALRKPTFQPPNSVFGPVWAGLYSVMAYSGYRTYRAAPSRTRTVALLLWSTQLVMNGVWSPLFFGRHRARAALVDSALLLATAGGYATTAARVDKRAGWLFAPYLGWLAFATVLNLDIVLRNRRRPWF